MGFGEVVANRQGPTGGGDGLIRVTFGAQHDGKLMVRRGEVRVGFQRPAQRNLRLVELQVPCALDAELDMRLR